MSCFMAIWAAFELFVFGSRHDFLISDIMPFSQSHLSNQYFFLPRWQRVTLFIFLLLFLDLYDFGMGEGSAS